MEQMCKAIEIAYIMHEGQKDKAGKPYILHPLCVMASGKTIEEKIVGVLHDTFEDTIYTPEQAIKDGFSKKIVAALKLITREPGLSYPDYIDRLINSKDKLALRVKLNDINHNISRARMEILPPEKAESLFAKYSKSKSKIENALKRLELESC